MIIVIIFLFLIISVFNIYFPFIVHVLVNANIIASFGFLENVFAHSMNNTKISFYFHLTFSHFHSVFIIFSFSFPDIFFHSLIPLFLRYFHSKFFHTFFLFSSHSFFAIFIQFLFQTFSFFPSIRHFLSFPLYVIFCSLTKLFSFIFSHAIFHSLFHYFPSFFSLSFLLYAIFFDFFTCHLHSLSQLPFCFTPLF